MLGRASRLTSAIATLPLALDTVLPTAGLSASSSFHPDRLLILTGGKPRSTGQPGSRGAPVERARRTGNGPRQPSGTAAPGSPRAAPAGLRS